MKTIKKNTSNLNDVQLPIFVNHLISSMTANAYFPMPVIPLSDVSTKVVRLNKLVETIKNGDGTKKNKVERDGLHAAIMLDVDRLFGYVKGVGGNNLLILLSSGFPLAEERRPIGNLPKPSGFRVRSLYSGSARLNTNAVRGADSYVYQYTLSPNPEIENWVSINETASYLTIENLLSGGQYKFRMCGVGAKGMGAWSDAMTCYIS